jgi:hypothetical protein
MTICVVTNGLHTHCYFYVQEDFDEQRTQRAQSFERFCRSCSIDNESPESERVRIIGPMVFIDDELNLGDVRMLMRGPLDAPPADSMLATLVDLAEELLLENPKLPRAQPTLVELDECPQCHKPGIPQRTNRSYRFCLRCQWREK